LLPERRNPLVPAVRPGHPEGRVRFLFGRLSAGFSFPARRRLLGPPRLKPVRPNLVSAFFSARLALRCGVSLSDYLQHRLAQRLGALPVVPSQLPFTFGVEEGGNLVARPLLGPSSPSPWLESLLRDEGEAALAPHIQLARAEVARLTAQRDDQKLHVEEAARRFEEASQGALLADPRDEASARRMGRPAVPPPLGLALHLFAALLMLAWTFELSLPGLRAGGLPVRALLGEFERDPVNALALALFGMGAGLTLFVLAARVLARASEARRAPWPLLLSAGSGLLAVGLAASVGGPPALARGAGAAFGRATLFLLALALPLSAAFLVRLGRGLERERTRALEAVRAWHEFHYRSYAELSRLSAVATEAQGVLARLEAERGAALRRLQGLQERVARAERQAADGAVAEQEGLARIAHGLLAALEQDRYEYLRQASARGLSTEGRRTGAPPRVGSSEVEHNLGLAG